MDTENRFHILLIDDEPNLLLGLKVMLERDGYQVSSAGNGTEGLKRAIEENPDLILCDVMMPPPNGFELRELLNRHPRTAAIPFIFLTARTDRSDRLLGLEGGADDYITKPFDRIELLARVKAVLRRAEKGRQRGILEKDDELERMRREISHNLGHELRTPLTVLLWTLELALHEKFSDRPEERASFVRQALGSAQQLHLLIEDMMTLNDLDRNELGSLRARVDLTQNFEHPIREWCQHWTEKQLKVEISIDPAVILNAPQQAFKRAVLHLLDNACKFSPAQGLIQVQLLANGNGGCRLLIQDQGPGIAPEAREKVFERFYQLSQGLNRQFGGMGVGLTVARAIAQRLGGGVRILDSEQGCLVEMLIAPGSEGSAH